MIYLAELNDEGLCVGIKSVLKFEDHLKANHIQIESMNQELLYRKYENGNWSDIKPLPSIPAEETLNDRFERLEKQIQEDNLMQFEVLATIYEELLSKG